MTNDMKAINLLIKTAQSDCNSAMESLGRTHLPATAMWIDNAIAQLEAARDGINDRIANTTKPLDTDTGKG